MIRVKQLSKNYGDFKALKDVSFEIKKGEIVGLLGPNGAGKTTTMKILTCFMPGTSGQVVVDGHDVLDEDIVVKRKIGYLSESAPLYQDMNVWEYLEYIADMHDVSAKTREKKIKRVIMECGLEEKAFSSISELSKGYKQRVGLAQALMHEPQILILDEPTSGLDPNQIVEIRNLIKKIGEKKTVILSTHILSEVEATCDRVLIINKGEIIASGTPAELKKKASGKTRLHLKVEGEGSKVIEVLTKMNGIEAVSKEKSSEKGVCAVAVETDPEKDLRKVINHHLLDNGLELLEMTREEVSLENIFRDLTR